MALAEIADRQARQIRQLTHLLLVQGVTLLIIGLVQIIHAFVIRGML